jgi:hypothetical protein
MSRNSLDSSGPWYSGITRYEWLVLIIASAGWIFDVYEGQIFNLTRNNMLGDILGQEPGSDEVKNTATGSSASSCSAGPSADCSSGHSPTATGGVRS